MKNTTHTPHPRIEERKTSNGGPHLTIHEHIGFNGRLAMFITKYFGTMGAFYTLALLMFGWMFLSITKFGLFASDPYPFVFLLFISNLIQLFALPILAVGQQVLSRAADKQAEQIYKDAETILKLQDEIHRLIKINTDLTEEMHDSIMGKKTG